MSSRVIDRLASCDHEIHTASKLRACVRWSQGFDGWLSVPDSTWTLSVHGNGLLFITSEVYQEIAEELHRKEMEEEKLACSSTRSNRT
jgi:hypothetical protein